MICFLSACWQWCTEPQCAHVTWSSKLSRACVQSWQGNWCKLVRCFFNCARSAATNWQSKQMKCNGSSGVAACSSRIANSRKTGHRCVLLKLTWQKLHGDRFPVYWRILCIPNAMASWSCPGWMDLIWAVKAFVWLICLEHRLEWNRK